MSVYDHLTPGEQVVARVGPFYATSHRMLRYEEGGTPVQVPYARVDSIDLVRSQNQKLVLGGGVMIVLGLILAGVIGLYTGFLAIPFGLVMMFIGSRDGKEVFYELRSTDGMPGGQEQWRVPYQGSMSFIATVGERSGHRPND